MLTIDGLITGIDTASVIEGLLQVQQNQIDRLSVRRSGVVTEQTAFSGVETRLIGLQGDIGRLANIQTTQITDKVVTSSDEAVITAAASDKANAGTYSLRVNSLAAAHQVASFGFDSPDAVIAKGEIAVRVGDGQLVEIDIDDTNNTINGIATAINASDSGMSAAVIDDGTAGNESIRLLLTSESTGARNTIEFTHTADAGETDPAVEFDFDAAVQDAADAVLQIGSGAGAILVQNGTNQFDEVIPGVTLNVHSAQPEVPITLTVASDTAAAKEAITGFVDSFNGLMEFIDQQSDFNAETEQASPLLGNRTVIDVQENIRLALTGIVSGNDGLNQLTALGIRFDSNGHLSINSSRLDDALTGQLPGVSVDDVASLFALSGKSDNAGLVFISGSTRTIEQNVQVDITSVAERALLSANNTLAGAISITEDNATLKLKVDGRDSSELTIANRDYTPDELATELQAVINADDELFGRKVIVSVEDNRLQISSDSYGVASEVSIISGTALDALGFEAGQRDIGQDVVGKFIIQANEDDEPIVEDAIGTGQFLRGEAENDTTADLQIRVSMTKSQMQEGVEGEVRVVRGLAARLDQTINRLLRNNGQIATANDEYDTRLQDIADSIDDLNERFQASQESLISQFAALESAVNDLNSTSAFLTSQLGTASALSGLG